MYAQTLTVVQPKLYATPKMWYRRVPKASQDPKENPKDAVAESPKKEVKVDAELLASFRLVQKRIVLLRDTMHVHPELPEDVKAVMDFVFFEFTAFSDLMQVTMGEPEKQRGFVLYMTRQIDKAFQVLDDFIDKKNDGQFVEYERPTKVCTRDASAVL